MENLRRDPEAVKKVLKRNEAGQVIALHPLKIQSPLRFFERNPALSINGVRIYVFGWHPIILESGAYSVMNVCGRMEITPDSVTMKTIDNVDYYEYGFEAGSVVYASSDIVQDDKIVFPIVDEMIFQAKSPWYMSYDDLSKLLDSAKHYAGSRAAELLEVIELLASVVARLKTNEEAYLRHSLSEYKNKLSDYATYIPLTSVHLSVAGTINRISGNYFEPAVEGALVTPSKKADNVEQVLRA